MMLHPTLKSLSRYLDHCHSDSTQNSISAHLNKCPTCRKKVKALKNVEKAVAQETPLPDYFTHDVIDCLPNVDRNKKSHVGFIAGLVGNVEVCQDASTDCENGFVGMSILEGDTIKLLADALVLIELTDGSALWLNQKTEMTFASMQASSTVPDFTTPCSH